MLEVDWFTPEDVSGPYPIIYSHDGSESTQDRFELGLSDGLRSVTRSFVITVIPVDDEPPFMVNNERISFVPGQQVKFIYILYTILLIIFYCSITYLLI
jgi:hypothetical protein